MSSAPVPTDVRLVPPALAAWAAAWWATASPAGSARAASLALAGTALLVVALTVVAPVRRARTAGLLVAPVLAVAALLCGLVHPEQAARTAAPVLALTDGRAHQVVLRVAGDPVPVDGPEWAPPQVRVRAVLTAPAGAVPGVPVSVTGDAAAWSAVRWGSTVRATVRADPAPAGAPVALWVTATDGPTVLAVPAWAWRAAERVRGGLATASGADGVRDGPSLLPGLVVGDTSQQAEGLVDDMRTAGLSHLTAVSGSNITIVCGGTLLLCVLLGAGRRSAAAAAALALVALVVVARPEPSVLRAAAMGAVGLLGVVVGRRGGGLAALAVAVLVVVAADPWLARAPGFRLSVVATGALVVGAGPLARLLGRTVPRSVAYALAVPAVAQVAVTPVLLGLEPVVATYALPANALAAPAVAPATVLGLLAAVLSLVDPATAAAIAAPAAWCAGWVAGVARVVAGLPGASLPWPAGGPGIAAGALAATALLALAVLVLRRLPDRRPPREGWAPWPWVGGSRAPAPPTRDGRVLGGPGGVGARPLLCSLAAVAALVAVLLPGARGWPGPDWPVVVCDVGQGDALLVRSGPGAAVLVDTGPDDSVTGCLRRAGVRRLDLLVLTHLHADHVGGLTALTGSGTRVARAWAPATGQPAAAAAALADWAAHHGVPLEHPVAGRVSGAGAVTVEVLAPRPGAPRAAGDSQDVNDAGTVVRLHGPDGLRVLAVGDLGADAQRRLLAAVGPESLASDVTTVAHHGSADQLPALYRAAGAALAVASAGRDNPYGHPAPRGLAAVRDAGTTVLDTAGSGDVAVRLRRGPGEGVDARTRRRLARGRCPDGRPGGVPA
ncbi:ComEC/Rec2 family competence protein [Aquipuribacter nitratireducens]|uniref:ComEC/Rec2 family competence protein n=1 Tax=Aquipuribacter nitratireducens TaxID=650104 RepID=A0ABW0GKB3_9MICO